MTLEALDNQLLLEATNHLPPEQQEFIWSKWPQIRHYACQNAGLKKWGKHLLRADVKPLRVAVRHIVTGIEMMGFKLWKQSTKDPHLEALFRLFFDDYTSLDDVDFTVEEKLALFWQYDASIITQFRDRFEKIFSELYQEMVWTQHDPVVTHMLIGNLIALYPYFDPPANREVRLLQHINNQWQMVSYRIETIPLVEDKIYAHGLIPTEHPDAYPILLFRGTPYPAARGFWEAIKSDLHPFRSVGEDIFSKGKKQLHAWMEGKPHIKCYGMSLGGALCYHLGKAYGSRVSIHAYVPPGLFPNNAAMKKIQGVAYFHTDDLVKSIGYHPSGEHFKCYAVLTEANRNFMLAHARPAGCNPTVVLDIDPIQENKKLSRHLLTGFKHVVSILLALFTFPFRLIWMGIRRLIISF